MARIVLKAKALKWGNSYGFRVTKADFEATGLHVGDAVEFSVLTSPGRLSTADLPVFDSGDPEAAARHDEILQREREKRSRARR